MIRELEISTTAMDKAKLAPVHPMMRENNSENTLDTAPPHIRTLQSTTSENEKGSTNPTRPTLILQFKDPCFIIQAFRFLYFLYLQNSFVSCTPSPRHFLISLYRTFQTAILQTPNQRQPCLLKSEVGVIERNPKSTQFPAALNPFKGEIVQKQINS